MNPRAHPDLGGRSVSSRHPNYRQPRLAYQQRGTRSPLMSLDTVVVPVTVKRHRMQPTAIQPVRPTAIREPVPPAAEQPTAPEDEVTTKVRWYQRRPRRHHVLYGMACTVFVAGLAVSLQSFTINRQAAEQVSALSGDTESTGLPSEEPLKDKEPTKNYRVAASLPRVITIDKLGVKARVLALDVDGENQMKTPGNIYDTAWYSGSAKLGEGGAAIINGHVSGPTKNGVFHGLKKLVEGDIIQVERGDGVRFRYAVERVETTTADTVDMLKLLNPFDPKRPGLNLITCGGKFNPSTNDFPDRIIVYTSQVIESS